MFKTTKHFIKISLKKENSIDQVVLDVHNTSKKISLTNKQHCVCPHIGHSISNTGVRTALDRLHNILSLSASDTILRSV